MSNSVETGINGRECKLFNIDGGETRIYAVAVALGRADSEVQLPSLQQPINLIQTLLLVLANSLR